MAAIDLHEPRRPVPTKRVRVLAACIYAAAVAALMVGVLPRTDATFPVLMILLGFPFIFRMVPRNYLYGTRSPRTLWTNEETWYRQNMITGVVMVGGGVIWLIRLAVA